MPFYRRVDPPRDRVPPREHDLTSRALVRFRNYHYRDMGETFRIIEWYRKPFGRAYYLILQRVESGGICIDYIREDEVQVVGQEGGEARQRDNDVETLHGSDDGWGDDETLHGD